MAFSIVLAVLAAVANATASVLQRKGNRRRHDGGVVSPRVVWDLLHDPVWVGGVSAILAGFLLQAAALATGPIALVQPVLVVELAFTLLLASRVFHSRLHRREWVAVAGMSAGVAVLLLALGAHGGDAHRAPALGWVIGSALTVLIVAALVLAGLRNRYAHRAAYLGVATGVTFGFTAALVAGMTAAYSGGLAGVFTAWQTYGVVMIGPAGFFLLQSALGAGRLVASQPGMTLANPLVAIGWGVAVFGEDVRSGGWIVADVLSSALIAVCTVALTRSPLLQGAQGGAEGQE